MGAKVIGFQSPAPGMNLVEALIASFGLVAIAEIGDKTQLLSFVLAARFRGQHWRIILGIFIATIINHALAAAAGDWVAQNISAQAMRWILGLVFLAFAAWALIPDTLDDDDAKPRKYGALLTTVVLFFLAEMGDKTQIATVAMAAHYANPVLVVIGTTLGMLIADVPAVFMGERLANRIPMKLVHGIAAAIFAGLGVATLLGFDLLF